MHTRVYAHTHMHMCARTHTHTHAYMYTKPVTLAHTFAHGYSYISFQVNLFTVAPWLSREATYILSGVKTIHTIN